MRIQIDFELPIKVTPIDNYYYEIEKKEYDVEDIRMGQSGTSVLLKGMENKVFNSIHFKYTLYGKEIDIYNSGLLNPYRVTKLIGISYKE